MIVKLLANYADIKDMNESGSVRGMQVHHLKSAVSMPDRPISLKEGEVTRATIKERQSSDRAVVTIRGRDVVATFEGGVPSGERATVQLTDVSNEEVHLKVIDERRGNSSDGNSQQLISSRGQEVTKTLQQLGVKQPTTELKQAAMILQNKGVPLTKENIAELHRFVNADDTEARLQTVQAVVNKNLDITQNHLRSVHEAMHGRPVNEVLTDLAKELDKNFKVEPVVRERLESSSRGVQQSVESVVREVRQEVQSSQTVNQARERIENRLLRPNQLSQSNRAEVDRALRLAQADAARGNERAGIGRLTQTLERIERSPQVESVRQVPTSQTTQQVANPVVREVRQEVQSSQTVNQARERIESRLLQPNQLSQSDRAEVDRALRLAQADASRGNERAGIERLTQTLERIERASQVESARQTPQQASNPVVRVVRQQVQSSQTVNQARERIENRLFQSNQLSQPDRAEVDRALRLAQADASRGNERAGIERLTQTLERIERAPQVESQLRRPTSSQLTQQSSSLVVREVRQEVQNSQTVNQARERIETRLIQPNQLSQSDRAEIDRALRLAQADATRGNERAGIDRLTQTLERIERAPQAESQLRQPTSSQLTQQSSNLVVREVRQEVQNSQTVNQARERIETRLIQPNQLSQSDRAEIDRALRLAQADATRGNERAGIDRLTQTLERIQRVPQTESQARQGAIEPTRNEAQVRNETKIQQLKDSIQREPIARAIDRLQQVANNPNVNSETAKSLERSITEAKHLDRVVSERVKGTLQQIERSSTNTQDQNFAKEARSLIRQEGVTSAVREQISQMLEQNRAISPEVREQANKALLQANQIQDVARNRIQQAVNQLSANMNAADNAEATKLDQQQPLDEAIKSAKMTLQKEANFERAVQQIQSTFNGQTELSAGLQTQLDRSIETAQQLIDQGRELKARQELAQTIEQIDQLTKPQRLAPETSYTQNEQFQTSVDMASKSIAVTTVTEKMAQMTADFKTLQRDISRNLDLASRQIDQFKNKAQPLAKPILESAIKKLDNAILKSEMMLMADMKTERQLMQASSQLAEATKLLARGKHTEANKIVQEVKQLVDSLNFKPSETKVKHYTAANEQALREAQLPSKAFSNQFNETARGPVQEGSPRAMFEMVRSFGLNRDSELAQSLASGREQQQEQAQQNVKSALMKLAQGEEEGARVQQLANQALSNLTGQQLMSKSDQQTGAQSLFFQLPVLLEQKVENLQVFVNSHNKGEKVDWENCSLYFLMETPKLGEIGIVVSASERQLSVTLKNDRSDFERRMEPLVESAAQKLSDIGYSISGIKYSKLTNEASQTENQEGTSRQRPVMTEKGFDLKI